MYGGTKSEMERLLADAQKLTGVKYDINNLSDVYSAIHAVQEEIGITGTTAKEASSTLSGSFSAMKSSFKNVLGALALGEGIGPALEGLSSTVSTFLFGNLIPMVVNILSQLSGAILTFIQTSGPHFLEMGLNMINNISSGVIASTPNFINTISELINSAISWVAGKLPDVVDSGIELITEFANGIFSAGPTVMKNLGEILDNILRALFDILPKLTESGVKLIEKLAQGIWNNLPEITKSISNVLRKLLSTISEKFPDLVRKGFELLGRLASGIWDNLPEIIKTIGSVLLELLTAIGDHLPQMLQKGVELLIELGSGLIKSIPNIVKKVPEIVDALLAEFGKLISKFVDIGYDILMGLKKGIGDAVSSVIDSVKGFCQDIWDGVTGFFGIHSPSRLFWTAGQALDEGLAKGITDNTRPVIKAMDEVSELTSRSLTSELVHNISNSTPSANFSRLERAEGLSPTEKTNSKQPGIIILRIGNASFKALVEDITNLQNQEIDLQVAYQ